MLGRRRSERQREHQASVRGGGATRYRMHEKLVSIGDDYWIENDQGQRVFKVDGKAMRIRSTLLIEDLQGRELAKIQEKKIRVRETMDIEGPGGETLAQIHKKMISPLRDRYTVDVSGGRDLEVEGNIVDHEYTIEAGGRKVAEVSRKWFRVRDTYGVEVAPGQNDVVILAVTVGIDMM
jgi:uncharacterized protein YxjI